MGSSHWTEIVTMLIVQGTLVNQNMLFVPWAKTKVEVQSIFNSIVNEFQMIVGNS